MEENRILDIDREEEEYQIRVAELKIIMEKEYVKWNNGIKEYEFHPYGSNVWQKKESTDKWKKSIESKGGQVLDPLEDADLELIKEFLKQKQ